MMHSEAGWNHRINLENSEYDTLLSALLKRGETMKEVADALREGLDFQGDEQQWGSWLDELANLLDPKEPVAEADKK
jgi:hypothetical protein